MPRNRRALVIVKSTQFDAVHGGAVNIIECAPLVSSGGQVDVWDASATVPLGMGSTEQAYNQITAGSPSNLGGTELYSFSRAEPFSEPLGSSPVTPYYDEET